MAKKRHKSKRSRPRKRFRRRISKRAGGDGASKADDEIQMMTASWANGINVASHPVAEADIPYLQVYLAAHSLLPPEFDSRAASFLPHIEKAFQVIEDPNASASALLRAIVILGHTASAAALTALQRHAESKRPHGRVAKLAADECVDWITHMEGVPEPALAS